jgi:hypothetical protein
VIADQHGKLGFIDSMQLTQSSDCQNFMGISFRILVISNECHFAIVVDEADASQAIVSDALTQFKQVKVAQINAVL